MILNSLEQPQPAFAEAIDRDWVCSAMHAADCFKKKPDHSWSLKLAKTHTRMHILQRIISTVSPKQDFSADIGKLANEAPSDLLLPKTLTECKTQLRQL
jgi:hypothetical protein